MKFGPFSISSSFDNGVPRLILECDVPDGGVVRHRMSSDDARVFAETVGPDVEKVIRAGEPPQTGKPDGETKPPSGDTKPPDGETNAADAPPAAVDTPNPEQPPAEAPAAESSPPPPPSSPDPVPVDVRQEDATSPPPAAPPAAPPPKPGKNSRRH